MAVNYVDGVLYPGSEGTEYSLKADVLAEEVGLLDIFEMGNITIAWNGWSYSDSDSRVRTIYPIYLNAGQKIGLKEYDGIVKYYLGWLKADGTYGTSGAWLGADFTVSESGYYVVLISNFQTQTDKNALASLFFGYSLNDKVNNLHTELDLSTSDGWEKYKFEKKQFSTADGEFYASNIRLSITQKQYVKDGGYLIARPGYYVALLLYNPDGTLLSDSGWNTSMVIPENSLACITLRRVDDGTITLAEGKNCRIIFNNFSSSFEVEKEANKTVCQNVKGINHRGWHEAPENTLVAYKESRKHGFKYVETDVRWTSDGIPVLLHDESINRTARNANGTEISGTVNIADITYAQSQAYDFGIYKGDKYAGEKIPKFEDFIRLCRNLGLHPYIEMVYGTSGVTESQVLTLVNIVKRLGMVKNVTWICVSPTYLGYVKKYEPFARLGIVANDLTESLIDDVNDLRDTYGDIFTSADNDIFVDVFYTSITDAEIELCIENGIEIEVWTVDTELAIRSLDPYVTGVTSNKYNAANVLYDSNIH